MAIIAIIEGQSGTGKTSSLRNFSGDEVAVANVSKKPMPFRSQLRTLSSNDYTSIAKFLLSCKEPSIVIDDATYLMAHQFFVSDKSGYDKFDSIGKNFYNLLTIASSLPEYKIVYIIGHNSMNEAGHEHFKTVGKMVDNYITVEGMATIVLKTVVKEGSYYFQTHNNGYDTVKTPIGMFEDDLIPNDLKMVDDVIREYWNIPRPAPEA